MPFDGTEFRAHKSVAAKMRDLFQGGSRWGRGAFYTASGRYCLMGAYVAVTTGKRGKELHSIAVAKSTLTMTDALKALQIACGELFRETVIGVNDGTNDKIKHNERYRKVIVPVLARMEQLEAQLQAEQIQKETIDAV